MKHRGFALAAACALTLLSHAPVEADSLTEHLGAREIAMGDSLRADAQGALAITLNPAGLALTRELVFEGSFGHDFGDGFNTAMISGCDSTVAIPGCFYYRYFSASLDADGAETRRRVHEGGATFGRAVSERVMLGVSAKYFDYESTVVGEEDASGFSLDVGTIVRPMDILSVGVVGYHVLGEDSAQYPGAIGAGVAVRPLPSLAMSFDGLWSLDTAEGESTGRYGGGLEYFFRSGDMQTGYPVRVGGVRDVGASGTYLTAGLGLWAAKFGMDVGARWQVQGGDDLLVQASLRIFGPRQVAGTTRFR